MVLKRLRVNPVGFQEVFPKPTGFTRGLAGPYFKVEGQTYAEVGIEEAAMSSNDPWTFTRFSNPRDLRMAAAAVDR